MTVHELSRTDARRIAVRAQLLDAARPHGPADLVRRLTLLQLDPTAAVAPSADLVAWSRLGSSHTPAGLTAALDRRRTLDLAAKRRWGYYALPILYADRLVEELDATADRENGVLRVDALHQDTTSPRP